MRWLLLVILLLAGCDKRTDGPVEVIDYRISVYHDAARSVTCWIYSAGGIACLPDSEIPR